MVVNTLTFSKPGYPEILSHITDPPKIIYWQGQPPGQWLKRPKIAVVGSRKFSPYGKAVTERLVAELARAGVVIISGLAYGIDITAHNAALAAGGTTVAILPFGLDRIYPSAHLDTAMKILTLGTLISEYPPGSATAFKSNFVARNRIISGLADAVLIPEATLKSGSLHTARFALEQGRMVMAVPGSITSPASEGSNNLIKSGAIPVTRADDILFALNITSVAQPRQETFTGSGIEAVVYQLIKDGITDQEELITAARIDTSALSSTLTTLEVGGHIRPVGAGNWIAA